MPREIPFIITLVFAITRIAFELVYPLVKATSGQMPVRDIIALLMAFGTCGYMFLGVINVFVVHCTTIKKRRTNWLYSIWLLGITSIYLVYGLIKGPADPLFSRIYNSTIVPLGGAMFSLLAFFLASASLRAFKARNADALVMLVVASLVMLANVPLGDVIWHPSSLGGGLSAVRNWLLAVPSGSSTRAISLGIFLGTMATSIRVFLGVERRHLGQD